MSQDPKKKRSSLGTNIIIAVLVIIILLGVGFYYGLKFQRSYNQFLFSMSQNMVVYSFWAIIILIAIIAIIVAYFVFKSRKKNKNK